MSESAGKAGAAAFFAFLYVFNYAEVSPLRSTYVRLHTSLDLDPMLHTYDPAMIKAISWVADVDSTTALQGAGQSRHMYLSSSAVIPDGSARTHLHLLSKKGQSVGDKIVESE